MPTTPARLRRVAVAGLVLAAVVVPLATGTASATGPTITRATVVYEADTNGDFFYGLYAAPESNPSARVAIVPESQSADVLSAAVSPDGTKVAAEVDRVGDGDYSLEVIDVATGAHSIAVSASHTANFASGYGVDGYGVSRDGATVTYAQVHWSTSPGGTRSFTETLYSRPTNLSASATAVNGGAGLAYPVYSQDGTKLAASNLQGPDAGLYVLDPSTGTSTKLASAPANTRFRDPTWSPDDKSIVASLAHLDPGSPVATTSDLLLFDPTQPASQTPAHVSPASNTHLDYQRPYFAMDGSLWFDVIDSNHCCTGDLWQAHKNSSGSWTLANRTPTTSIDEGGAVLPRPVDDGAPTDPVTFGTVGLGGRFLLVHWTVPAGLDDYSHVVLHRTGDGQVLDIENAFGTSYADYAISFGQTYTYTATVYDGSGNAGPTTTGSVTATATGVQLASPSPTSAVNSQLPFHVLWSIGGPSIPGVTYDVNYAVKGGTSWTLGSTYHWYTGTTLGSATFTKGVPGQTYYFQATVHDGNGNASSTSLKGVNVPLDQKVGVFSHGWGTISNSQYWLGSIAATATNGASVTFTTTSKSEALIGDRCPACATFAVYLDGHYRGTFNSYGSTRHRQVLWSWVNKAIGKHTIKVVAVLPKGRVLRIDGLANPR